MALPPCIELDALPDPKRLTLPGGITLEHFDLLTVVQPALTPLMPLFAVLDAVLAVFNVVKAIKDAFGPPPNPAKLIQAIPELTEKIDALLRLVPQLSIPYTVVGLIDLIIDVLGRVRSELSYLQAQLDQLALAVDRGRALDDAGLLSLLDCARKNVEQEAANVVKALGTVGHLLGVLNLLMSLFGGPEVPPLDTLDPKAIPKTLEVLDTLVETLRTVRKALPLP